MIHPDDKPLLKRALEETLQRHTPFSIDYRFVLRDGTIRIIHAQAELIPDSSGKPVILSGTGQDITERKLAEKSLIERENQLQESQEVAKIGSWSLDVVNDLLEWSGETYRRFDKDPATFTPTTEYFISRVHPDDREGIQKAIDDTMAHDVPYHIHPRIRNESGREWVLEGFGRLERDAAGRPVRFAGTAQDVTERKRIEGALQESEALYRNLVETTAAIAWEVDIASLSFTYISPQVENITGYPPEEWTGFAFWAERIHPDDRENAVAFCQAETGKGLDHAFEYRMAAADGSILWIRDVVSVIMDNDRPVTLRGFFIDITASKMAEEKLRESEEFVRRILDTMDAGVISIDADYRIKSANKAFCGQVGRGASEIIGKHCYEVTHGSFRPCYEEGEECAVRQVFEDGGSHVALHHHTDAEGSLMYVETKAFPVKDTSGNVVSAVEMITNITEKHLLEEERLKAQKLESIGTLAGGIAHDFNNLLQGVFGHISMARMSIDRKEESLTMLEQAEKALHQAVSLTNQLLTFAKGGKPVREYVPILPVVESATRFSLSGSSCDYEILPQVDLWQVNGDAGQIGQVIQNIALNADQSMPRGGKIKVTVRNVPSDSEKPEVLEKGDYVLVSIMDSGLGIPEKYRERIFDPYFTTKERGSGLGLATSYSIVQNHGGIIEVESKLGEGATFSIYLPAVRQVPVERPAAAAAPVETRSVRVLVMDDEEMIRKISGKLLRALGHECEFAEKGESAVAMFKSAREEGRPFDLVILDQTIRGGMGGTETLGELLSIDPEVQAIVSSGYSNDGTLSDYRKQGFKVFLKKPYNVEDLREAVSSALE
jgi:PAS domain S-box-containing protein